MNLLYRAWSEAIVDGLGRLRGPANRNGAHMLNTLPQ